MMLLKLIARDFRANGLYLGIILTLIFVLGVGLAYGVLGEAPDVNSDRWMKTDSIELLLYCSMIILSVKLASVFFFKVDEMNDTEPMAASLPVRREAIVKARYLASTLVIVVAFIVHLLAILPAALLRGGLEHLGLNLMYHPALWVITFIILLLSSSFSFPLYFRFGLTKGMAVLTVIQVLLVILAITVAINFVDQDSFFNRLERLIGWVSERNALLLITTVFSVAFLLMAGSAMLSVKLYNTRDL
ncbi:MAG: hypothetical protein Roseis2KO_55680 [Roseivirga sp.]